MKWATSHQVPNSHQNCNNKNTDTMTQTTVDLFNSLAPLLLPQLIDLNLMEEIEEYDDYALITFTLPRPMTIDFVMDCLEDQMELNILYHMVTSDARNAPQHCCAYSNPAFGRMYKLNAQTNRDGMVDTLYVYLYDSLEVMLEDMKSDIALHSRYGRFVSRMEMSRFIADFM